MSSAFPVARGLLAWVVTATASAKGAPSLDPPSVPMDQEARAAVRPAWMVNREDQGERSLFAPATIPRAIAPEGEVVSSPRTSQGWPEESAVVFSVPGWELACPEQGLPATPFTVGELYQLNLWAATGVENAKGLALSLSFQDGSCLQQIVDLSDCASGAAFNEAVTGLGGRVWRPSFTTFAAVTESAKPGSTVTDSATSDATPFVLVANVELDPVPEPGSALFLLSGLAWRAAQRRRKV